jgi:transcription initiation factor TFIIIB Brf1 subunit/transcription initiation factor TFIIB
MQTPTCPKCPSQVFTLADITIDNAKYKMQAVVCASCGTVVSVIDMMNIGAALHGLATKLGVKL